MRKQLTGWRDHYFHALKSPTRSSRRCHPERAWLGPIFKWIWKIMRLPENALKPDPAGKPSGKSKEPATKERNSALLDPAIVVYLVSSLLERKYTQTAT
jgi:hypothetical protein